MSFFYVFGRLVLQVGCLDPEKIINITELKVVTWSTEEQFNIKPGNVVCRFFN